MIKKLLFSLMIFFTLNSFAVSTYAITKGLTTSVTCNVGDTLKFYGQVPAAYGVTINSAIVISAHPVSLSPYYIGYYVITGGETSFTIVSSVNWTGTITVNTATGIIESAYSALDAAVYPNPVINEISFKNLNTANVIVYDAQGKQVKEKSFTNEDIKLNIADLPKGIYLVEVLADGKRSTTKLVKE